VARVPRRVALVGLAVGIVLAVGPALLWWVGGPGAPPDTGAAASVPAVAPAVLHDPVPARPAPVAAEAAQPAPPAPPVRIRVAGAGVDAPVVVTGVDERGGMAVPEDIRTVGWYRFGVGPGAPAGSAVLAGHVDDRIQGRGAFYRLADLPAGSPVEVTLADGAVVTYRVSAVERVPKTVLPADRLFARDGPPQLALITCGGAFDRAKGGYTDNVVVTAAPEQVRSDPQGREPGPSASAPTAP
jgi:Sortase domain